MKVLVTGATGFIGRHVVRQVLRAGHSVIATAAEPRSTVTAEQVPPGVTYIPCNINEPRADYYRLLERPEAVIHLSWEGLPNYRELFHFERNLPVNYRFLKSLVEQGVRDITVIGTCLEYGIRNGALSEEMAPEPTVAYAVAKDSLRRFLEELKKKVDFRFRWIRLFYTYGEGQNERSLLEQLKKAIARGDESFDMSPGDQLRDYLPVEEIARCIVKIALQGRVTGIINCCSGVPVSVKGLVESYLKATGSRIALNLGAHSYPDYEAMAFWGDTRKLRSILEQEG